jgi:ParB-like chromosome segregation protein Spo0J
LPLASCICFRYVSVMQILRILVQDIDFEDETFRISEDLELDRICQSLQAIGMIQPAILAAGVGNRFRIVCGFRRVHGMRRLKSAEIPGSVLDATVPDLLFIAVWDNLSHRKLNVPETSRVISKLKQLCAVSDEVLIQRFLPALGLPPHINTLRAFLDIQMLHPDLRRLLNAGSITMATAERLARIPQDAQASLSCLLTLIRLSASLQRELLDIAEDLAAISNSSPWAILASSEVTSIAQDASLSRYQRGEKIHKHLYQLRNPRITTTRHRFLVEKAALNLPGTIRISADPFFESPGLKVEFEAGSAPAFREAVNSLERACHTGTLDNLFDYS